MNMMPWILLQLGCDPLAESVRDEAIWYDTERIVSEAGVALVPISSGEPVGYWPRVVIREEGIDVDNRAWVLTLPEAAYAREVMPQPLVWSSLVPLQDGRLPAGTESRLIKPLYEAMLEMANASIDIGAEHEEALFDGRFVVVPEPGIPWRTISAVLYSASQAMFSSWALAGEVDGHLRYPGAPSQEQACPYEVTVHLTSTEAWIDAHPLGAPTPPLTGAGGCAETEGIAAAVAALAEACVPRWHAAQEMLGEQPVAGRDCVSVILSPDSALSAAALLHHQARLYEAWPAVEQGLLSWGSTEDDSGVDACQHAIPVASLRPEQLDYICDAEWVARTIQEGQHAPSHRARSLRSFEPQGYDLEALTSAFPDYVAKRGGSLPPPSREPLYQSSEPSLESVLLGGEQQ